MSPIRKTPSKRPSAARPKRRASSQVTLLVATRKGAFIYRSDAGRRTWKVQGPMFLGHIAYQLVVDPRDRRTLLLAARTGHLGPTVFRSTDLGRNWKEAAKPPAFPKAPEGQKGRVVDHVFWLTPGHPSEPGVWYAGTSPQGLFRSEDGGDTWAPVAGFNDHPMFPKWTGGEQDGTPDGPKLHSILVDPRDANHLYLGMSSGGVFETTDRGGSWTPLNRGCIVDYLPDPNAEYGHDTHALRFHPSAPDTLYQQNHGGIFRMERSAAAWTRIGASMPKSVGDVGFPLVLHPRHPQTLFVFPMDGSTVWPRTSPGGKPAAYASRNGGRTWQRLDGGLPKAQAWFTVKRQAMSADSLDPAGLYFGTTSGEIWASRDEGKKWSCIARHLPHIYSVEAAELGK